MSSVSILSRRFLYRVAGVLLLPGVAVLTLAADRLSKYLIQQTLRPGEFWAPLPFLQRIFRISYVTNTGAAFGLFPNQGGLFIIIAIAVSLFIILYYRYLPEGRWLIRLSLGLQLGGAIGNLFDRLRYGYVIDFVDIGFWPVFNLADSAIVLGVGILAYCMWYEGEVKRKDKDKPDLVEDRAERV
jgi:signal peptidase II